MPPYPFHMCMYVLFWIVLCIFVIVLSFPLTLNPGCSVLGIYCCYMIDVNRCLPFVWTGVGGIGCAHQALVVKISFITAWRN